MVGRVPAVAGVVAEDYLPSGPRSATTSSLEHRADAQPTGFTDRYAAVRPLDFDCSGDKLNHQVFRFPAKFYPPVARKLIELVSKVGETVLDPFCGSGTLLVEVAALGRNSVGSDVDPLAVFVTRAKTDISDERSIADAAGQCTDWLQKMRLEDEKRWGAFTNDIEPATL